MASLTTERCAHEYLSDRAGEPCVWCGAPRPEFEMSVSTWPKAGDSLIGSTYRITADPLTYRVVSETPFLAARDPGDED